MRDAMLGAGRIVSTLKQFWLISASLAYFSTCE